MRWALVLILGIASGAGADTVVHEPSWIGAWTAKPEWCVFKDKIGSHTPAPIGFTADSVDGYENSCSVQSVTQVGGLRMWRLVLKCHAEGATYDEETVVALESDDAMWRFYEDGAVLRFTRCG